MTKKWARVLAFMVMPGILLCWIGSLDLNRAVPSTNTAEKPLILLDPGHGGIDGGASGTTGLLEKDINLDIALRLRDFLCSAGYHVQMTRETDCSVHDAGLTSTRDIKVSDIHNRLKMMQEHRGCIFVSVHQNHFTESKYSGAQFFYSKNQESSKILAECFRSTFCRLLQPENAREIKPCGKEIYLMYHAETTAVLAECGFLSNPAEDALLHSEAYRAKVAFALFCGLLRYCET